MIGFQIFEFTATFLEALTGIWFNGKVLSHRLVDRKSLVYSAAAVAVSIWMLNQYQLFSVMISMAAVCGVVIGAVMLYRIPVLDSLVVTAFYLVMIYVIDFFSISVFGILFQDEQYARFVISEFSKERMCFITLSKILLIVTCRFCVRKGLSEVSLPIRKMWMGIVLSIFFLYYLMKNTFDAVNVHMLWRWSLFLVLILLSIYSLIQYAVYLREKTWLYAVSEQNQRQLEAYDRLIQDYQKRQIFYHDLKNQYLVIGAYLKNQEYEKAEVYMEELKHFSEAFLCRQRTGIQAVDILLDYKINEAKDLNIYVDVETDAVQWNVKDQDAVALLGNAFDNAIEACKGMRQGVRWIRVIIRQIENMTLIKISNSYENQPKQRERVFLSSKSNPQAHGVGIRSMEWVMESYEGQMKIEYEKGEFSMTMLFFG